MRVAWMLCLTAALAGCEDKADCEREAAALGQWLQTIPESAPIRPTGPVVEYAGAADTLTMQDMRALMFQASASGVSLRGEPLWSASAPLAALPAAVGERMDDERAMRSALDESAAPNLAMLEIAPDTPWRVVVAVLDGLAVPGTEENARVALLFRKPAATASGVRPPRPSKIDKQLAELRGKQDSSEKVVGIARLMQDVLKPCPPAMKLMGELAMSAPEEKERLLKTELPHRVADCKCKCDVDALRAILWALLAPDEVQPAVVKVTIAPRGGSASKVSIAGDTTWAQAYDKLLQGYKAAGAAVAVEAQ